MRFIRIDIFIRNASALALPPYETHFDAHARPTLIAMHSASSQNALNWIFNAAFCKTASHTLCSFTPSWKSPGVTVQFEHCIVWCILHTSCSALLLSPLNIRSNRGLEQNPKNHCFGVFQVCPGVSLWSEYAPRTTLEEAKFFFWR